MTPEEIQHVQAAYDDYRTSSNGYRLRALRDSLAQKIPVLLAHIASLGAERDLLQDQLATQDSALADAAIIEERRDAECEALAVQMTSLEARIEAMAAAVAAAQMHMLALLPVIQHYLACLDSGQSILDLEEERDALDTVLDSLKDYGQTRG